MRILSLNIGLPKEIPHGDGTLRTAIWKTPCAEPVPLSEEGLAGDGVADRKVHGGIHKAVYAFPHEHYAWYQDQLGRRDFVMGQFGENLTTEDLLETEARIGDRWKAGEVVLEISQPRIPCFKLNLRMNDARAIKLVTSSLRTGFYLRVLRSGNLTAGLVFSKVWSDEALPTVREVARAYFGEEPRTDTIRHMLACAPLSPSIKDKLNQHLKRMTPR